MIGIAIGDCKRLMIGIAIGDCKWLMIGIAIGDCKWMDGAKGCRSLFLENFLFLCPEFRIISSDLSTFPLELPGFHTEIEIVVVVIDWNGYWQKK